MPQLTAENMSTHSGGVSLSSSVIEPSQDIDVDTSAQGNIPSRLLNNTHPEDVVTHTSIFTAQLLSTTNAPGTAHFEPSGDDIDSDLELEGEIISDSDMDSDDEFGDWFAWNDKLDTEDDKNRPNPHLRVRSTRGGRAPPLRPVDQQALHRLFSAQVDALERLGRETGELYASEAMQMIVMYIRDVMGTDCMGWEISNANLQVLWRFVKKISKQQIGTCLRADSDRVSDQVEALMDVDDQNRELVMADPRGARLYAAICDTENVSLENRKIQLKLLWTFTKRLSTTRVMSLIWGPGDHRSGPLRTGTGGSRLRYPANPRVSNALRSYVQHQTERRAGYRAYLATRSMA